LAEITVEDKVNYWKDWIGLGSEWLTVDFEPVEYISEESPHCIESASVAEFVDGRFIRNYR